MALELNSSNSSQFSSQTPQLQNFMELPTPWNCSAYEGGVLEHLFYCSRTTQYVTRFGVGGLLPTNATYYIKKGSFLSPDSPDASFPPRAAGCSAALPSRRCSGELPIPAAAARARTSSATSRTSCRSTCWATGPFNHRVEIFFR